MLKCSISPEAASAMAGLPIRQSSLPSRAAVAGGWIQPPAVGTVASQRVLLWGRETVAIAERLALPAVEILDAGLCTPLEAARYALEMEHRPGRYEAGELVALLDWLEAQGTVEPDDLRELVDGGKAGALAQAERIRRLPAEVREMVLCGSITHRHAEQLAELPPTLAEAIIDATGRMSFSERREVIAHCYELIRGRRSDEAALRSLLAGEEARAELTRLRYPSYTEAKQRLQAYTESHLRGTGVSLEAPTHFEGDTFTLGISFSTAEELKSRLELASRITDRARVPVELLG